jgi:hypothetical protein
MIRKYLSIMIIGLLIFSADSMLISAQTISGKDDSKAEKVKSSVMKRGAGGKKRVLVKMLNGTKLNGYITQAGEDSFTLTDSTTRQPTVIAYRDVEKVGSSGLSKGAKIAIGVGAAAAVTFTILFAAFLQAAKNS